MARRRRHLGWTPQEHRQHASEHDFFVLEDWYGVANEVGSCADQYDRLTRAELNNQFQLAHLDSMAVNSGEAYKTAERLDAAQARFYRKCMLHPRDEFPVETESSMAKRFRKLEV